MLAIEEIKKVNLRNLPTLLLVTGDDIGQFEWMKQILLRQIGYDSSDLNMAYFDMKDVPYADIEMDLVSLPFFADEKIVILDHFLDLTTSRKRYLSDEELKKFESYLENPSETTKLILFAGGKLDSKRRLVKMLKRDAQIFQASELKEAELRTYFKNYAQKEGVQISDPVLEKLLMKSSWDFSELTKNITFLKTYKKEREISLEDIEEAIPKTLQDNLFDLTQMVLNQEIDQARSLVKDLTLQGEDVIKLIFIMIGRFRILTQVKILSERGRLESQIVSDLSDLVGKKVNPHQIRYALRDSKRYSLSFLNSALLSLIEADYQIKSGVHDKEYLFDLALLKIATSVS